MCKVFERFLTVKNLFSGNVFPMVYIFLGTFGVNKISSRVRVEEEIGQVVRKNREILVN